MCRRSRAFTLVEFLFVLAILVILLLAVPWTFRGFAGLWFLLGVLTWLAAVAAVNKGRIAFGIAMIPVIGCLIWICTMLPTVYPTRFARLRRTTYDDQPLASVLLDIAGQKDGYPSWRFMVSELDLAQRLVSVEIPDGCKLERALELVSGAAGCEYHWHWHKACGNAPSPGCAVFCFSAIGGDCEVSVDAEVIVDAEGTYYQSRQ